MHRNSRHSTYYSPPAVLVPKLLPTSPVKVQNCLAAFVHDAVVVLPTLTQATEAEAMDVIDVMSRRRILRENISVWKMMWKFAINLEERWK